MWFCPVTLTVYSIKQCFLDGVYSDGPWWWCVFPGSWHDTQWAFQPRFIMVHKHTRPQRRKASASFYFCSGVKSVNEEPLLFGFNAFSRNYFLCNSYKLLCAAQWSEEGTLVPRDRNHSLCWGAPKIAASSGGQERDASSYPQLSKYDLCTVATSWYIHTSFREPSSNQLSLFNAPSKFVMQERIPPVLQECKLLYHRNIRQFRWFSSL